MIQKTLFKFPGKIFLLSGLLFTGIVDAFAQQDIRQLNADSINQLKVEGKLTGKEYFTNSFARISTPVISPSTTSAPPPTCDCWIPRDASWQIGAFDGSGASGGPGVPPSYRNDDWSTLPINLPFDLCFYGTPINSLYLNNNGNVSIGAPYSTFTATAFPNNSFVMIAPFWGDVDTRDILSGLVYYKLTPSYMIIQWENVGYFSQASDKLNTFQLILTDGTDPILPSGQNISFCYKDMQWTTGDASGGNNGFGGTPATVGVNRGNGTDYIQVGLFDQPGGTYDGPFGNNDGIDALDFQSFYFNSCVSSSNVAPLATAIQVCDTVKLCRNDTIQLYAEFLSPEQNQITTAGVDPNGMSGVSILNSTSGNTASITVQVVGTTSNIGYHTIYITGTDNGTPPLTNSTPVILQVMPVPTTSFTFTPPMPVSPGTTVTFTNTTVGGFSYVWDFGDGSPTSTLTHPTHTYVNGGTYVVTLTATGPNGCSSTASNTISVSACSMAAITVTDTVCEGAAAIVTFTGIASPAASYNWNFGSGTVVSGSGAGPYTVIWNTPGNQNVYLNLNDGSCPPAQASMPVHVVAIPNAEISTDTILCEGDQSLISFTGTAAVNASFNWNLGNSTVISGSGTPSDPYTVQWNNAGTDSISLTVVQNGCSDAGTEVVEIFPVPGSGFTVQPSVCAGTPVQIDYTGNALSSADYTWNFDGGIVHSGSGQGPYQVSWNNPGIHQITLNVTQNSCPSVQTILPIDVTPIPVAAITADPELCPGEQNIISFNGTSEPGALYNWDVGNATLISGSGAGPLIASWSQSGTDEIRLIVEQNGCQDTGFFQVLIYNIPSSAFSLLPEACSDDTVQLIYSGSTGSAGQFTWDFNGADVISGNGSGPFLLKWTTTGIKNISLTVSENGCLSPLTIQPVTIHDLPAVNAGSDTVICSGESVNIGLSGDPGLNYSWSPVNGLSDPAAAVTSFSGINNSSQSETRYFVLTAISSIGCRNRDTVSVRINPVPAVSFQRPATQCLENNSFQFNMNNQVISGASYVWDFGPLANPASSTSAFPPAVTYPQAGTYLVTLNASFGNCVAVPYSDSVTVVPDPYADFQPVIQEGCVPLMVPFINLSTGDGNTYEWSFSDNSKDTSVSAQHLFTSPGTYTVNLLTRDRAGCTDYISYPDLIKVYPLPQPVFTPNPQVANLLEPMIQFINSTPGINEYFWEFGDGSSSLLVNPDHLYSETGEYTVTLYATNIYGCLDSIRAIVRIEDYFTLYIPNTFTPNGDGRNDYFSGFGTRLKTYQMDILDRWGLKIYSTNDINKPWDGKVENPVQADVYIYRIEVTDNNDKAYVYTGHVNVIR